MGQGMRTGILSAIIALHSISIFLSRAAVTSASSLGVGARVTETIHDTSIYSLC